MQSIIPEFHLPISPLIAPSLLAANFAKLGKESLRALKAGADWLHLDVMDGHFVPNLSFGPPVVSAIRGITNAFLDVHLMIERPDLYLDAFIHAGASLISIHTECLSPIEKTLQHIADAGIKTGLAIKPHTPLSSIEPYLEKIDLLLLMTVEPGFGGQSFMESVLPKIDAASQLKTSNPEQYKYLIEVDGGINEKTSALCRRAGAEVLVAGSSTFQSRKMSKAIKALRKPLSA